MDKALGFDLHAHGAAPDLRLPRRVFLCEHVGAVLSGERDVLDGRVRHGDDAVARGRVRGVLAQTHAACTAAAPSVTAAAVVVVAVAVGAGLRDPEQAEVGQEQRACGLAAVVCAAAVVRVPRARPPCVHVVQHRLAWEQRWCSHKRCRHSSVAKRKKKEKKTTKNNENKKKETVFVCFSFSFSFLFFQRTTNETSDEKEQSKMRETYQSVVVTVV